MSGRRTAHKNRDQASLEALAPNDAESQVSIDSPADQFQVSPATDLQYQISP